MFLGFNSLKELNLSSCSKITDAGIKHILSITSLEKLFVSETRLTADGVKLLSCLTNLRALDLGGIPVTDKALSSLQVKFYCFLSTIFCVLKFTRLLLGFHPTRYDFFLMSPTTEDSCDYSLLAYQNCSGIFVMYRHVV